MVGSLQVFVCIVVKVDISHLLNSVGSLSKIFPKKYQRISSNVESVFRFN